MPQSWIFNVVNMPFNTNGENKILTKISELQYMYIGLVS